MCRLTDTTYRGCGHHDNEWLPCSNARNPPPKPADKRCTILKWAGWGDPPQTPVACAFKQKLATQEYRGMCPSCRPEWLPPPEHGRDVTRMSLQREEAARRAARPQPFVPEMSGALQLEDMPPPDIPRASSRRRADTVEVMRRYQQQLTEVGQDSHNRSELYRVITEEQDREQERQREKRRQDRERRRQEEAARIEEEEKERDRLTAELDELNERIQGLRNIHFELDSRIQFVQGEERRLLPRVELYERRLQELNTSRYLPRPDPDVRKPLPQVPNFF